jgi:hypothetical protein
MAVVCSRLREGLREFYFLDWCRNIILKINVSCFDSEGTEMCGPLEASGGRVLCSQGTATWLGPRTGLHAMENTRMCLLLGYEPRPSSPSL